MAKDFTDRTARCVLERNCGTVHVIPLDLFQCELHLRRNMSKVNGKKFIEDSVQNRQGVIAFRPWPFRNGVKREFRCRLASHVNYGKLTARSKSARELEPRGPLLADRKLRPFLLPRKPVFKVVQHLCGLTNELPQPTPARQAPGL